MGVGLYTVTTAAAHPLGAGSDVLYGSGLPGTSFNTIRSYTTGTDYVQVSGALPASGNAVVSLDPFATVSRLDSTGLRTKYELPGPPVTPDGLTIYSDVQVQGASFKDSRVEIRTTVRNHGLAAVRIGVRHLADVRIENDDGPGVRFLSPGAWTQTTEGLIPSNHAMFAVEDNDMINLAPPTYRIVTRYASPDGLTKSRWPEIVQFNCWASSFFTAFDYPITAGRDIARLLFFSSDCRGTAGGDSAIGYYWGATRENSIAVYPGSQMAVWVFLEAIPSKRDVEVAGSIR